MKIKLPNPPRGYSENAVYKTVRSGDIVLSPEGSCDVFVAGPGLRGDWAIVLTPEKKYRTPDIKKDWGEVIEVRDYDYEDDWREKKLTGLFVEDDGTQWWLTEFDSWLQARIEVKLKWDQNAR